MKKAFLSAIVACAVSVSGFAQQRIITYVNGKSTIFTLGSQPKLQELGSAVMEFMYDYHYLKDTTDVTTTVKDRMILQVSYGMAKFTSFRAMQVDSLLRSATADDIKSNPARYTSGETFSVYKNYPSGKFTITDKIADDWFIYEEDIPQQEWTLTEDVKEVLGYKCRSAKCSFRGREWTAWYSDEIPVADGPWKFGGLPGFILEVNDAGNQYGFVCVGINSQAERKITMPQVQYNKTTRGKYYATKYKYDFDPIGYMATVSGVQMKITDLDGSPRTDLTQAKELTYDYIERDWR